MVLATHLVTGAVLGQVISNPALALFSGFISHFLLDAIPHWDYHLASLETNPDDKLDTKMALNRDFIFDLAKISLDLIIGVTVLFLTFKFLNWQINASVILAALGAIIPDFLQFAYFKLRWPILRWLQAFHVWIHAVKRLDNRMILGPLLQAIVALSVITLAGGLL